MIAITNRKVTFQDGGKPERAIELWIDANLCFTQTMTEDDRHFQAFAESVRISVTGKVLINNPIGFWKKDATVLFRNNLMMIRKRWHQHMREKNLKQWVIIAQGYDFSNFSRLYHHIAIVYDSIIKIFCQDIQCHIQLVNFYLFQDRMINNYVLYEGKVLFSEVGEIQQHLSVRNVDAVYRILSKNLFDLNFHDCTMNFAQIKIVSSKQLKTLTLSRVDDYCWFVREESQSLKELVALLELHLEIELYQFFELLKTGLPPNLVTLSLEIIFQNRERTDSLNLKHKYFSVYDSKKALETRQPIPLSLTHFQLVFNFLNQNDDDNSKNNLISPRLLKADDFDFQGLMLLQNKLDTRYGHYQHEIYLWTFTGFNLTHLDCSHLDVISFDKWQHLQAVYSQNVSRKTTFHPNLLWLTLPRHFSLSKTREIEFFKIYPNLEILRQECKHPDTEKYDHVITYLGGDSKHGERRIRSRYLWNSVAVTICFVRALRYFRFPNWKQFLTSTLHISKHFVF